MRASLRRLAPLAFVATLIHGGPLAAEPPSDPPEEAVLATLPFADAPITRVALDLAPPGQKPFVLYLDTGATDSVLTPLVARELGVRVRRLKRTPYRRRTVLGRDLQFWIDTQSSETGSKTGWEYGFLGGSFLDDYVLEIDYPARRVRFLDRRVWQVPESVDAPEERVLPIRVTNGRPFTEVELGGRTARVLLDTGAPSGLVLSGRVARELGIDVDALDRWGEFGGVLGDTEARLLETDALRWAGFDFAETPVLVLPRGFYNQGGSTDSLLGYDLLRQFTMRIDYQGARIWLRRGDDRRATFFGEDWALSRELGASITQVGPSAFQVWNVEPGGAAARFGLRNGDVVVNAQGEAELTPDALARRVLAGEPLTVARRQGEGDVWLDVEVPEPRYDEEPEPSGEANPAPADEANGGADAGGGA